MPELRIIDDKTFEKAQEVKKRIGRCFIIATRTRKEVKEESEQCPWCGNEVSILDAYCSNCREGLWVTGEVFQGESASKEA